jgi:hypothetical protein
VIAETTLNTEAPRAEPASDLSEVKPIVLKEPTLLAQNDPYNSIKATAKAEAIETDQAVDSGQKIDNDETETAGADIRHQKVDNAKSDAGKPVLRAIPVEPKPEETPVEIRRALPVGPMDEVDQGALLKAVTPSPGKSDDQ